MDKKCFKCLRVLKYVYLSNFFAEEFGGMENS